MKQFWVSSYDKFSNVLRIGGNDDKIIIQGKEAIQAAKAFLNRWGDNRQAKRSASNDVNLCLNEVVFEEGRMLRTGKVIWYQLK
jgi:hypothetical protein